jgi:hypothetical protein
MRDLLGDPAAMMIIRRRRAPQARATATNLSNTSARQMKSRNGNGAREGAVNADEAYIESYIQTDSEGYFRLGRPPCHPGCNPDGKVPAAKWRFSLAIQLHPCRFGSSAGHRIPSADPSLPTTERGISGRDGKNRHTRQGWGFI